MPDLGVKNLQLEILFRLLSKAAGTTYGKQHNFTEIQDYSHFCDQLPICFYEDIESQISRMKKGETDLLWPGEIEQYAVSAGTTGVGKHLPLSAERLRSDYRFMRSVAFSYLKKWRRIPNVFGKHLSLPGTVETKNGISIGEISGYTALHSPWWLRPFHLRNPRELTHLSFKDKFELVLDSALQSDISVIVAVPSWILTLFQQAMQRTGKSRVSDIWPSLKLMICGGVKLANYRPHLEKLYGEPGLDFIETYGSSEGYFAFTDHLEKEDLKLVHNNDIFYEFIPDPLPEMESLSIQPTVPLWEVEPHRPYAMLVTTNTGLWRYAVKDIVTFTSVDPPRIKVMGRLNEMLDDYGEALQLYEAEEAMDKCCDDLGLAHCAFTVGSFLKSEQEIPCHYWFIQFTAPVHTQTLERLSTAIDEELRLNNRHYAIRRESGALGPPTIRSLTQQDVNSWLDFRNKGHAQSKLPKMLTDKEDLYFFLDI
ncbi:GH3 auxin-responsive promoter family protein [Aliifodinibius sp. S!AR15-10]|uniref:GH3 family domain-containing protein n=1 Tax=Aliifodinibius sp. S!AR15-10 TaxID=2950437 RepID=UPI002859D554|nr:GH3 auxin-responsive promoter family protein [Aliifodinibius sp. S!AR15-10]MDR8390279.1 GH3 auxin-responsive promoter family protein [Aliifodinibius sp. S!AR15-10]